jgi:hypothetical protein
MNLAADGGYIIAGATTSFGNGNQVYLIKTYTDGILEWENNYGGTGGDCGCSVLQTPDGGFLVTGYTNSFGNGYQAYLLKVFSNGTLQWQRNYGGTGTEVGFSGVLTADGNIAIGATRTRSATTIRYTC